MALDLRTSELEHNFIKERISSVEKLLMEVCEKVSAYMKKLAHLRDSGDDLAKSIVHFASKENLNQTLRVALGEFSDILSTIQEYRDTQVQRIDVKVVFDLKNYETICKQAKTELKKCFEARARELSKKNHLEKTRGKNPTDWQKIAQAEKEVNQAQDEATRTTHELAKQIDHFERQKLEDIKRIFLEFIKIEMIFHAKAIELYTKAYNVIKGIRVDDDLNEFRCHFRGHSSTFDADNPCSKNIALLKMEEVSEIPNTSLKIPATKGIQGPQRSVLTQKTVPLNMDQSCSSFDSYVEHKYQFGDHSGQY